MARTHIAVWLDRNDYEAIKRLVGKDSDLPDTFDEWLEGETKRIKHRETLGERVKAVHVNSQEFSAWCAASGTNCNDYTLFGFAVATHAMQGHLANRRIVNGSD